MTKLLCIDTSTICCAVGLLEGSSSEHRIVEAYHELSGRRHSEVLVPTIRSLLLQADWSMADIDALAIGIGPGSYTGLRIGLSVAKALCLSLEIPLITVSTLQTIAAETALKHKLGSSVTILSMMDARRNEVYLGAYSADGRQILQDRPRVSIVRKMYLIFNFLRVHYFLLAMAFKRKPSMAKSKTTIDSDIYILLFGEWNPVYGKLGAKKV